MLLLLVTSWLVPTIHGAGVVRFQKTWGGSNGDFGKGVAVSHAGEIYVTGYTDSFGAGRDDVVLLKYNSLGNLQWQRVWGGPNFDEGYGVVADGLGNVYVTGAFNLTYPSGTPNGPTSKLFVLKFNSTGNLLWSESWGSSGNNYGQSITPDPAGNIYVLGRSGVGNGGLLLLKLTSTGNLLFGVRYNLGGFTQGNGIALDSLGNIVVTGTSRSGSGGLTLIALKLNSSGNLLWQRSAGGTNEVGNGVSVVSSGDIFVTGYTSSYGAGGEDVLLLKFNSTGGLLCERTWGSTNNDEGRGIALDSTGNAYITGIYNLPPTGPVSTSLGSSDPAAFILKLSSGCSLISENTWGGGGDAGNGITVDSAGHALVAGSVGEAPPYSIGSGNATVGIPHLNVTAPNGAVSPVTSGLDAASGSLMTPIGSESYAYGGDIFLVSFADSPSSAISLGAWMVFLTVTLIAVAFVSKKLSMWAKPTLRDAN